MSEDDDISDEELEELYDKIDADIAERGLPSDEELRREIERLNLLVKRGGDQRGRCEFEVESAPEPLRRGCAREYTPCSGQESP